MSNKFRKAWANMNLVEKPGASSHSAKWDRCIQHVKENGKGANAYAVCTDMLGEESFKFVKSEKDFTEKMDEYMRKLGISGAGPVPNSLLARQNLEGRVEDVVTEERMNEDDRVLAGHSILEFLETTKSMTAKYWYKAYEFDGSLCQKGDNLDQMAFDQAMGKLDMNMRVARIECGNNEGMKQTVTKSGDTEKKSMKKSTDAQNFAVWYYDRNGAQKCAVFQTEIDAQAYMKLVTSLFGGGKDAKIVKSEVEETKKDLIDASMDATEADGKKEKTELVDRIKAIQIERQKATIRARERAGEATGKSFKQGWQDATK